ncbi:hypothetical protein P7B02_10040 [Caulobacter segnis]|uniref:hypothetical protein n=1 Tax=Caulobacter segnis TaxID=88688 RepID=UPI00241069B8|nr:hypothetical protein [Caulobacter segnis]MDG2521883.1 hypothetical protein [Caulobacter segnis]
MRRFLHVLVFTLAAMAASSASAQRPSGGICPTALARQGDTLQACGILTGGFVDQVIAAITPETRTLVLTSVGGFSRDAIRLADAANQRELSVEIDRVCLSACAHFVLTGAEKVTVRPDTVVGFHRTDTVMSRAMEARGLKDSEDLAAGALLEQDFFQRRKMPLSALSEPQALLEPQCIGLSPRDGSVYVRNNFDYYVPTREVLEVYRGQRPIEGYWPKSAGEVTKGFTKLSPPGAPRRTFRFGNSRLTSAQMQHYRLPPKCATELAVERS